jgi:hypothetical protein
MHGTNILTYDIFKMFKAKRNEINEQGKEKCYLPAQNCPLVPSGVTTRPFVLGGNTTRD